MWQKLGSLDLPNGLVDKLSEFVSLLIRDGGVQILNLDQALAHEHHLGDFGDSGDPRVANQLRIES